jgi:hypothetical protein
LGNIELLETIEEALVGIGCVIVAKEVESGPEGLPPEAITIRTPGGAPYLITVVEGV